VIRFGDGPAVGELLALKRAPLYLRAVFNGQTSKWDALDQLADVPGPEELLVVAYRRVGPARGCMVDWTVKGRKVGGRFASANYEVVAEQPDAATLRETDRWRAWCWEQVKANPNGGT
jgi:hypothetical protein